MKDFTTALNAAQAYATYSYAPNTRQAYASDWRLFAAWCATHQRRALPTTPETVLGSIGTLALQVRVATIDRRVRGIAFAHRQAREPDPTTDPEVRAVLRGLRRKLGTAPAGKTALTVALLQELVAACAATTRGSQERALCRSQCIALEVTYRNRSDDRVTACA